MRRAAGGQRHSSRSRRVILAAVLASLFAGAVSCSWFGDDAEPKAKAPSRAPHPPTVDSGGGVHNPTFYYAGKEPLRDGADLSALGKPSIVVTTPGANEQAAVRAIHSVGAKAYRYVQFYWAPDKGIYEGIDLGKHPGWAFCRQGKRPLLGRTTTEADGAKRDWYFLDTNERALRSRIAKILASYKAKGWDGLMWDRGGAATQNATDAAGRPVWDATSSCTDDPHKSHAQFADAYVDMLGLARQAGLQVMLNTGTSAYDPVRPFRPDPTDAACRERRWEDCSFTEDGRDDADLLLNESIAFPRDKLWQRTFDANQQSEREGRRVVGLLTTYTLGGPAHQNRADVFYEWARVKLFDLPLAVNTGDDGCDHVQSDVCNRFGTYPELIDVRFGQPVASAPRAQRCIPGSDVRCLWTRQYANGLNIVNVSGRHLTSVRFDTPDGKCRYVYDVFTRKALSGNTCISRIEVDLPPWSGRPLLESTRPWSR